MQTIKIGTTNVEIDIAPKKFSSGKNGYYGRTVVQIAGKKFVVQIMAYESK